MFGSFSADVIIVLIAALGLFAGVSRIRHRKYTHIVEMAPGVAVSLGIFGTFVGVYIGLIDFDVNNISASIPQLLEGLKTAFMTSIWGIAVSIGLRFLYGHMDDAETVGRVRVDDPVVLLQGILDGIEKLNASTQQLTNTMVSCLRGSQDDSVMSQFLKVREDIQQSRAAMVGAFEGFTRQMAETGIDVLIKALEEVIRDFNALLGEMVGSAFQDLSGAMVRLVEWQENYRQDMDVMRQRMDILLSQTSLSTDVLDRASAALSQVEDKLGHATRSLADLSVYAADLEAHVEALKTQNMQLQAGLESIRSLGESAQQVIPSVEKQMQEMTQTLVQAASQSASQLAQTNTSIAEFVLATTKELKTAGETQTKMMKDALAVLDKGLETELTKALNSLAGSLAALSERFVRDYQPLTERLREVVRLAEVVHDRKT
jgi:chromosome segregation ATPase